MTTIGNVIVIVIYFYFSTVVIFGFMATGIAILASKMPGHVSQVSDAFLASAAGPLLGMFLLGGVFSTAEWIVSKIHHGLHLNQNVPCQVSNDCSNIYLA